MDANGVPTVCNPDPRSGDCIKPYHAAFVDWGGPHNAGTTRKDVDGGKMDGFVANAVCKPGVRPCVTDVMGYHDRREIPTHWAYAENFVLQDRMFAAMSSWSLPAHLFLVSGWSAKCNVAGEPMSCKSSFNPPTRTTCPTLPISRGRIRPPAQAARRELGLLHLTGQEPDCITGEPTCPLEWQNAKTPGHFNPLPWFDTVKEDGQVGNVQSVDEFAAAAAEGPLPAVSWVVPNHAVSEHPPGRIDNGQAYVTHLVNSIMAELVEHGDLRHRDEWRWFLRPRAAADDRPAGVRNPGAGAADQPLRSARLHRPPDAQLRRLPQVHRGPLPRRRAHRSRH